MLEEFEVMPEYPSYDSNGWRIASASLLSSAWIATAGAF